MYTLCKDEKFYINDDLTVKGKTPFRRYIYDL